mgnify:CR=1 FL=1
MERRPGCSDDKNRTNRLPRERMKPLMNQNSNLNNNQLEALLKLTAQRPLVVEIPDRHSAGRAPDSITRYIREAIGVKV